MAKTASRYTISNWCRVLCFLERKIRLMVIDDVFEVRNSIIASFFTHYALILLCMIMTILPGEWDCTVWLRLYKHQSIDLKRDTMNAFSSETKL